VIGQRSIDTVVDASSLEIGFKLRINRLRITLVKPPIQFINLLLRQRVYGAFDFLYCT
jgi:hypothetical protein